MFERLPNDVGIKIYTYLYIFVYANIYLYLVLSIVEKVFTEVTEKLATTLHDIICSLNLTDIYENPVASE